MNWAHILATAIVILVTALVINKSGILEGKSRAKRFLIQFVIYFVVILLLNLFWPGGWPQ